ncbi:hypothetical protein [Henriciella marina]|uniref:hypothetical protein n=1 Tax=Henriciella marina TaxID=453851 RepID=UPI0003694566|nr:hypothetical protein [Henriciella marina]
MKLIIGYFALIVVLLASLSVFANAQASARAEADEAITDPALQQAPTEADAQRLPDNDVIAYTI